ncbi:hypothetical protein C9J85_11460 [Haloferax sp. wsp5]|nr:hypothetical protein C9J85_11460 [Haloferax sp. wsp5]
MTPDGAAGIRRSARCPRQARFRPAHGEVPDGVERGDGHVAELPQQSFAPNTNNGCRRSRRDRHRHRNAATPGDTRRTRPRAKLTNIPVTPDETSLAGLQAR